MIHNRMLKLKRNRKRWAPTTTFATTKPTNWKTSSIHFRSNRIILLILLILSTTWQQVFNRSLFSPIWKKLWSQTMIPLRHRLLIRCQWFSTNLITTFPESYTILRIQIFFNVKMSSFLKVRQWMSVNLIEGECRWNMLSHRVRGRFDGYTDNDNNNFCCDRAASGWQHRPEGNVNAASFEQSEQQRIRQLVTNSSFDDRS